MQALTIERNRTWEELSNPSSDFLWNAGLPGITGWVQIEHARDYNLPRGIPSLDKYEVYITTWGHQHHCLVRYLISFNQILLRHTPPITQQRTDVLVNRRSFVENFPASYAAKASSLTR